MVRFYFLAALLGINFLPTAIWAQSTGQLYGTVYDDINGVVLPFAEVLVEGGPSVISDINGDYRIEEVPVGLVDVSLVFIGYEGQTITEVRILGDKATKLDAYLSASTKELDEVVIQGKPFEKIEESPLSVRVIGTDEIERFPGGNRDVSRVIQSLPGVSTASRIETILLFEEVVLTRIGFISMVLRFLLLTISRHKAHRVVRMGISM